MEPLLPCSSTSSALLNTFYSTSSPHSSPPPAGSDARTKQMAASQVAEACLAGLEQLPSYSWRLYLLLSHKDWETRCAFGFEGGVLGKKVQKRRKK